MKHHPGSVLNVIHARRLRRALTSEEQILWRALRKRQLGVQFRRQVPLFGYVADFFATTCDLAIEVDGPVHDAEWDANRDARFDQQGIKTLRFRNAEVIDDLPRVIADISAAIARRIDRPT